MKSLEPDTPLDLVTKFQQNDSKIQQNDPKNEKKGDMIWLANIFTYFVNGNNNNIL